IEVQLPFIQFIYSEAPRILPIAMKEQSPRTAEALAEELLEGVKKLGRDAIFIASTDMSHYEPHDLVMKKDLETFEKIAQGDTRKFFEHIVKNDVSMCGPGGVMVLMHLSRILGGRAELLKYATSGDVTGERDAVVGYLSARFSLRK
ncbi:MAG: AmmeMemoRadiSam system protein B, partial [Fervidicoccaceae archaeon]